MAGRLHWTIPSRVGCVYSSRCRRRKLLSRDSGADRGAWRRIIRDKISPVRELTEIGSPRAGGNLMGRISIAAALWLLPVSLSGQWLNLRTPGIPRTADGKPDLTAPAPRTPEGKLDLSGLWRPEASPYRFDVIQDLKDEGIFRPEAEDLFQTRVADFRRGDPVTHCLPGGPLEAFTGGAAQFYRIVQSPAVTAIIYESGFHRQIFTDGRELPKDPNPTWMGYSVGHWEGDALVVESAGFNDRT